MTKRILMISVILFWAVSTLSGCAVMLAKSKPPIIITGPTGVKAENDDYLTIRIKNTGSAYWRFWLWNDQQVVLYPGRTLFIKPVGDFWNACQGFWAHAYLQVKADGRVKETTFAGEQWMQVCTDGQKWVCETGEVIGADIFLGNAPGARYPFPTKFSYVVPLTPLLPIGIQGAIR